jgi:HlyD family secretion protein
VKKKYVKVLIILVVVVLIGSIALSFARNKTASSPNVNIEEAVAVSVEKAAAVNVNSAVTLNGKLKPVQEINIIPKLPGKVSRVNFDIGQVVKSGDVLFTLDDKDIRLQVMQAQAGLDAASAGLSRVKGGANEQQMVQLQMALTSAEISFNDAKLALDRTTQLFESGVVSKAEMERAESQFKMAEQQYNSAKTNLELTQSKTNPENIAASQAQVNQARAAVEIAKSQLDNSVVKSPISGVVATRNLDAGEMVSSAAPAMSIIDLSSVIIDVNATEDIINKIKLNSKVEVSIKSAGDKPFTGEVINISPSVDLKTQTYPVRVKIDNKDGLLKAGMFAEVKLSIERIDNTLSVPLTSVVDEGGLKYVYVLKGDKVEKRAVTTGIFDDKYIQVLKGITDGEEVVVKGQELIQDGSKVVVTEK